MTRTRADCFPRETLEQWITPSPSLSRVGRLMRRRCINARQSRARDAAAVAASNVTARACCSEKRRDIPRPSSVCRRARRCRACEEVKVLKAKGRQDGAGCREIRCEICLRILKEGASEFLGRIILHVLYFSSVESEYKH